MKASNLYTFIYASVMVILVAAVLSFAASQLKPYQDKNVEIAKKLDILKSVNLGNEANDAPDKDVYIEEEYDKYIPESLVVNGNGELVEGVDAFDIKIKEQLDKDPADMTLPVFVCQGKMAVVTIFFLFMVKVFGDLSGVI